MGRVKQIANTTQTELAEYLSHIGWSANPFINRPSLDEYVLPSSGAIADITAAVQNYTGPVVIHSPYSGAGKTTLLRVLLDEFDDHRSAYVSEHNVTAYELASIVADDLGVGKSSSTKLTEQKIRAADFDSDVIVGIDEFGLNDPETLHVAQFLNDQGFKLILTGMTSQYEALGQPVDDGYVADERAFRRRISSELELEPLAFEKTLELFRRRVASVDEEVTSADWERVSLYPYGRDTLRTVHEKSEGVPGVVVTALNRLLSLAAYQYAENEEDTIDPSLANSIQYADPRADI
jgi:hypothetical protein